MDIVEEGAERLYWVRPDTDPDRVRVVSGSYPEAHWPGSGRQPQLRRTMSRVGSTTRVLSSESLPIMRHSILIAVVPASPASRRTQVRGGSRFDSRGVGNQHPDVVSYEPGPSDAENAEIHFVVRGHDNYPDQTTTFDGGCAATNNGPYTCGDVQASIHNGTPERGERDPPDIQEANKPPSAIKPAGLSHARNRHARDMAMV